MKKLIIIAALAFGMSASAQIVGAAAADSIVNAGFNITKELNTDSTFMCYKGWGRNMNCVNTNFYYCSTNEGDTTFTGNESLSVVQDSIKSWFALQSCMVRNEPIVITLE